MGMDQSIFIGPYLQGPKAKNEMVEKSEFRCPKHWKRASLKQIFCSECGSKYEKYSYLQLEPVDLINYYLNNEEFEDDLMWSEGLQGILIPNDQPPQAIDVDVESLTKIDLTKKDLQKIKLIQIKWFEEKYKGPLVFLRKKFGEKRVHVKWGIVAVYN